MSTWVGVSIRAGRIGSSGPSDIVGPSITSVTPPANGTYSSSLTFYVNFDEATFVTGTPRIQLTIGSTTRYATYSSGSGTTQLTFVHTIVSGDSDSNGITMISPLQLNGGTLKDEAENNATLTYTLPNTSGVLVDAEAPSVSSVTCDSEDFYFPGKTISATVVFTEAITVTGTPRLTISVGVNTRYLTYSSGSGTTSLVFQYTFTSSDDDTTSLSISSPIDLNSGTLRDAAGNNASLVFSAPDLSGKTFGLRGLVFATDFTEGADSQKLYATLDGTQISVNTGRRGLTTGATSTDPSFVDSGASYDGGDYWTNLPTDLDFIDTAGVYTIYARVYVLSGWSHVVYSSASVDWSKGTSFTLYPDGRVAAANQYSLGHTYIMTPSTSWRTKGWHTVAWASDGTTVTFYLDGQSVGTLTGHVGTTAQTDRDLVQIGNCSGFGQTNVNGSRDRAFAACNVCHDSSEIAANSTYLASIPVLSDLVTTGLFFGTDFSQGTDANTLYGTVDQQTVSNITGVRNGATFASAGATFDGDDEFNTVGSIGQFEAATTNTKEFSFHARVKCSASDSDLIICSTSNGSLGTGSGFMWRHRGGSSAVQFFINTNGGILKNYTRSNDTWVTLSVTGSPTEVKLYADGVQIGTTYDFSGITPEDGAYALTIGSWAEYNFTQNLTTMRAFLCYNITHSDQDVADIHTFLSSLPS